MKRNTLCGWRTTQAWCRFQNSADLAWKWTPPHSGLCVYAFRRLVKINTLPGSRSNARSHIMIKPFFGNYYKLYKSQIQSFKRVVLKKEGKRRDTSWFVRCSISLRKKSFPMVSWLDSILYCSLTGIQIFTHRIEQLYRGREREKAFAVAARLPTNMWFMLVLNSSLKGGKRCSCPPISLH